MTPSPRNDAERDPRPNSGARASETRPIVLLVEDDDDSAHLLQRLLGLDGYDVRRARSHAEALAEAERPFDVLVSDLVLPDGHGRELVRDLARRGPLRALACSGESGEEAARASREAGFDAHIVKPIDYRALRTAIERVLARQPRPREATA